jgi:RNA polymerase sigma-70 factor (ECF subfamily)
VFGQSRRFRQILQEKWHDCYRVAYAWCHDSDLASDLVQETISRCLKHKHKFKSPEDVRLWLFKVLANCWRDHLRRQKPHIDIDDITLRGKSDVESEHYRDQILFHVNKAYEALTQEQRQVLTLVVIEGFSYVEVANILEIPTGTVMSRLCRARSRLKELMADVYPSDGATTKLWRIK